MRRTFLLVLFFAAYIYFPNAPLSPVENSSQSVSAARAVAVKGTTAHPAAVLTRANFDDQMHNLYRDIKLSTLGLDYEVFRLGMVGYYTLKNEGALNDKNLFTIIDFSKASTEKRFFTLDLEKKEVLYNTFVAHGRNTGQNMATKFSNIPHSNQSSLGFYVTGETYVGSKGYSLRLDGKEAKFNDKIRSRAVVMHAADYATEYWINRYGRLGRSQGCPALPPDLSRKVIDDIKNRTAIFTYYPDEKYLNASRYLDEESLFRQLDQMPVPLVARAVEVRS